MVTLPGQSRPIPPPQGHRDAVPVFGNAIVKKAAKTAGQDWAERASNWFFNNPKLERMSAYNPRLWNLSLQDWSARIATALAFYVPQTIFAFQEDRHKIETLARNIIVWTATMAILVGTKYKSGLNTFLNPFLKPKEDLPKGTSAFKEWINNRRFDGEIFDYLKKHAQVDLKNWSGLDANHFDDLTLTWKKLQAEQSQRSLSAVEKQVLEKIPKIVNRISAFKFIAVGLSIALLAVVVGKLAMDVVFKFFAPLDHDFDPSQYNVSRNKDRKKGSYAAENLPSRLVPAFAQKPVPFANSSPKPAYYRPMPITSNRLMPNGYPPAPFMPFAAQSRSAYPPINTSTNASAFYNRRVGS